MVAIPPMFERCAAGGAACNFEFQPVYGQAMVTTKSCGVSLASTPKRLVVDLLT
jgi:hypothetical protein